MFCEKALPLAGLFHLQQSSIIVPFLRLAKRRAIRPQNSPLPKAPIFLYGPAICDVRPAPGRMQRIGGGGNGAAMQREDTAGAVGASI
jgi:hypothetical protein